jgi:hypothetical protein
MNPPVKIRMKESICICLLVVFACANSAHADTCKTYTDGSWTCGPVCTVTGKTNCWKMLSNRLEDTDADGIPNKCDPDSPYNYDPGPHGDCDGDGITNINDPDSTEYDPYADEADFDGDTIPNGEDETPGFGILSDDDNDGTVNICDHDSSDYSEINCAYYDFDFDGIQNYCDSDTKSKGGFDPTSGCPNLADLRNEDWDGDGIPNYKDQDLIGGSQDWVVDDKYKPHADSDGDGTPNVNDPDSEAYDETDEDSDADGDGIPNKEDHEESTDDQCPEGQVAAAFGSNAYAAAHSASKSEITCVPSTCLDSDSDGVCDQCDPFPQHSQYYSNLVMTKKWVKGGNYCAYTYTTTEYYMSRPDGVYSDNITFGPGHEANAVKDSAGNVTGILGCTAVGVAGRALYPQKCSTTCDSCSQAEDTVDWSAPAIAEEEPEEEADDATTDSDNNGIPDKFEADKTGGADVDNDGLDDKYDSFIDLDNDGEDDTGYTGGDTNGDGIKDSYQVVGGSGTSTDSQNIAGMADALARLTDALGLGSSDSPGEEEGGYSPIGNNAFATPYGKEGGDISNRFNQFLSNVENSDLFSFSSAFFDSLPSGGSPTYTIEAGQYGTHTVDLEESFGSGLPILKSVLLVCFGYLSIRAIIMKR